MVELPNNNIDFPCLPCMKLKSSSTAKSITIKVRSEALTPTNNLQHTHNTRCRKQKSERRLTIEPPPLKLPNHARALSLLTRKVPSPTKSPPTKKAKSGERLAGCCSCSLKSKCSKMRCVCKQMVFPVANVDLLVVRIQKRYNHPQKLTILNLLYYRQINQKIHHLTILQPTTNQYRFLPLIIFSPTQVVKRLSYFCNGN